MATQESEAERTQRVMGRALREKESQLRLGCVRASGRESQPASPPGGVCRLDPAAAPAHGLISPRFRSTARGLAPPLMCLGRRAGDATGARGVCVCVPYLLRAVRALEDKAALQKQLSEAQRCVKNGDD